jgi:hypothetical protein
MRHLVALSLSSVLLATFAGCGPADPVTPEPTDPAQLAPPAKGQGFQFTSEETPVPPGTEEQDCYFFKVSELSESGGLDPAKAVNLHRVQVAQRAGSHHMNLFKVATVTGLDPKNGAVQKAQNGVGECFKSANWADWPLIANSQTEGNVDWTFPDGVANVLQPDDIIMLQTHYVNAETQKTQDPGLVRVNFWSIPNEEVTAELGTIFATKQSIRICEHNPTPVFEGSCQINSEKPVTIIGANGHFHSRGTKFEIYSWDGTTATTPADALRFYESDAWDEPPMMHSPELQLALPPKGGIWYTCSYDWTPPPPAIGCKGLDAYDMEKHKTPEDKVDCCYTFGPVVDRNEHCNAFVYYYPKQDDVHCQ